MTVHADKKCDVCGAEPGRCMTATICQQTRDERSVARSAGVSISAPIGARDLNEALALAQRWRGVFTDESHGVAGKNLGILARAVLDLYRDNMEHGADRATRSAIKAGK